MIITVSDTGSINCFSGQWRDRNGVITVERRDKMKETYMHKTATVRSWYLLRGFP